MSEMNVTAASWNELQAKAKELGLDVPRGTTKEALRDLVGKQLGVTVNALDAKDENGPEVEKNLAEQRKQRRVKIRIHEQPNQPSRVPVCVNGVTWTMKAGAVVEVPESVVEVLRNAVQTHIHQTEQDGKIITHTRDGLQFPFEILP